MYSPAGVVPQILAASSSRVSALTIQPFSWAQSLVYSWPSSWCTPAYETAMLSLVDWMYSGPDS